MPEVAVIMELDRPAIGFVDGLARAGDDFVTDNLNRGGVRAEELGKNGMDESAQAGGEDNDLSKIGISFCKILYPCTYRNVMCFSPTKEGGELRVESYVREKGVDAGGNGSGYAG